MIDPVGFFCCARESLDLLSIIHVTTSRNGICTMARHARLAPALGTEPLLRFSLMFEGYNQGVMGFVGGTTQ